MLSKKEKVKKSLVFIYQKILADMGLLLDRGINFSNERIDLSYLVADKMFPLQIYIN